MRCLLLAVALLAPTAALAKGPLEFRLSFSPKLRKEAFTGRAYVVLTKGDTKQLMRMVNWFKPEPFFAQDFTNVKPGAAMVIDRTALGFPVSLDKLPKGTYTIQAVIDLAPGDMSFATAPGNLYTITRMELDPDNTGPVELKLDREYQASELKETERIKPVKIQSRLLTAFHRKATWMRAAVILPASYEKNPGRKYPVYFEIPGFSGNHLLAPRYLAAKSTERGGVEVIHVILDPNCHHGHHVFADSANNGPWGKALVEELVPIIDARFRTAGAKGRLVGGHSSGGWSSLWLQITYPDEFNGCWSTSPDPVDFRDFQQLNIYDPKANFFTLAGKPRPVARLGKALLYNKPFVDMETVMGHGGQLASFEGCFSERGPDGQPKRLWDRKTGKLDPAVAKSWEKYDIRLVLSRRWKELGPKLKGKLHVYMGEVDTFYLEGATRLLKKDLEKLGSDAKVELFPGLGHGLSVAVRKRVNDEMAARLKALKVVE